MLIALHLVDKDNHNVQLKGAVLVRVPVSGEVAGVYYTASGESVNFTNGQGTIEFTTSQLGIMLLFINKFLNKSHH